MHKMNVEDEILKAYEKGLRWLTIRNAGIKTIPKQIENLEKLERLQLDNNPIESFNIDFSKLKNLEYLDLYNCNIKTIPPGLAKLPKLKSLNLSSNQIQDCKIDNLPLSLKSIYLSNNNLKKIPDDLLIHQNINHISVNDNQIENIENLLNYSKQIFILDISNNKIASLPEECSKLKIDRFICSSNLIENIPNEIWMIQGLEIIDLSKNRIRNIPECNEKIRLFEINLSSNKISILDNDLFHNSKLYSVNICNNNLVDLPISLIEKKDLRKLDISNNKLINFPYQILERNLIKFKWQNNNFNGIFNDIINIDTYYENKLNEIWKLNLIDFLNKSNNNILDNKKFDSSFPIIEKQENKLVVKNISDIKNILITDNCTVDLVFQKPAKGGGGLSIRITNSESNNSYIYNEYGNTPTRKYVVAKFATMISKLINKEFKIIDGGYDC